MFLSSSWNLKLVKTIKFISNVVCYCLLRKRQDISTLKVIAQLIRPDYGWILKALRIRFDMEFLWEKISDWNFEWSFAWEKSPKSAKSRWQVKRPVWSHYDSQPIKVFSNQKGHKFPVIIAFFFSIRKFLCTDVFRSNVPCLDVHILISPTRRFVFAFLSSRFRIVHSSSRCFPFFYPPSRFVFIYIFSVQYFPFIYSPYGVFHPCISVPEVSIIIFPRLDVIILISPSDVLHQYYSPYGVFHSCIPSS